ncbi:MAG: hypothetical protein K6E54_01580 [Bacteroidaceae bacterium]|nr:hypothetical protein [Bacteroidaceae bacterium]
MNTKKLYFGKSIGSFFLVLFTMPLGHALMMLMEHYMSPTALHYSAFFMGFLGFVITVMGIFVKGDTKQTVYGLAGGLLFWTGWVEFLMAYYAQRYGTHCDLVGNGTVTTITEYVNGIGVNHQFLINGTPIEEFTRPELKALRGSRPEYLTMPSSFGFFMMFAMIYICCIRTGCNAINWCQLKLFRGKRDIIVARPMTRHTSIVTFMELNTMMWALYLVLMFCYDPVFLGDKHPVTLGVAIFCLIGSFFMFKRELKISSWGANIRMAIATVVVFWTFVEVMARNQFMNEIWVAPLEHQAEMWSILGAFILAGLYLFWDSRRGNTNDNVKK